MPWVYDIQCATCGNPFNSYVSGGRPVARYCSRPCIAEGRKVPIEERFWQKVDKRGPDECWPWQGHLNGKGYGKLNRGGVGSTFHNAHRIAWEIANGPIPEGSGFHGTCVLHRCDNPPCCNPAHLFLGTNQDNVHDMWKKGRKTKVTNKAAPCGEKHYNTKLTEEAVRAIRRDTRSLTEIARAYGIAVPTAHNIRHRVTWKHVY